MIFSRPSKRRFRGFDLTPMIDVVLQLIIFFLFTSQLTRMIRTPIDLPVEPGDAAEQADRGAIVIDVRRDGDMLISGEAAQLDRIVELVEVEIIRAGGDPAQIELLVRADRLAPAIFVNTLVDRMTDIGVRRWKVATAEPGAVGGGG